MGQEKAKSLHEVAVKEAAAFTRKVAVNGLKDPVYLKEVNAAYYEGMFSGARWQKEQIEKEKQL